jgi:hypothetical protein
MTPNKACPCIDCKHLDSNGEELFCAAFPDGIPDEILSGENKHTAPLPEQNNNVIYQPIEEDHATV